MYKLNEDLFDDVVDIQIPKVETEITIEPELEGPQTGEDVGIAGLILDAISTCANNINQYNILKANLTDAVSQEVLNDVANNENITMGKLQSLLKTVSPNAESIMNGAVDAEQILDPGSPVGESYKRSLKEEFSFELYHQIIDFVDSLEEKGYDILKIISTLSYVADMLHDDYFDSRNESLNSQDQLDLSSAIYNAVSDVIFKNGSLDIDEKDIKFAFDRFIKKFFLDESLQEEYLTESSDGWSESIQDVLYDSFDQLESLMYEVRNCVRGAYTNCETSEELADYVDGISNELSSAADEIRDLPAYDQDEDDDFDSMNESLMENFKVTSYYDVDLDDIEDSAVLDSYDDVDS